MTAPQTASERMLTAARILDRLFTGRRDTFGQYHPDTQRGVNVKEPITEDLLLDHVYGRVPAIGVYPVMIVDGVCRSGWFCVDIDRDGDYDDAKRIARKILDAARPLVRMVPERSKGKGIHLWVFHAAVETWKARAVGRHILKIAGVAEGNDGKGREVVVFPKQDLIRPGEYGNFVYLPWQGARVKEGRSAFLNYDTLEAIPAADQIASMASAEPVAGAVIDDIVSANGLQPGNVRPINKPEPSAAKPKVSHPVRTTGAAAPGQLAQLTEEEFGRLVDMSAALTAAVRTPGSCGYKDWITSLIHMVPFADGKQRSLTFSSADAKRFKETGFNGFEMYWDSAVRTYSRDHATAPRWSQRVVDDWRVGGARFDIDPISTRYGFYKNCLVERVWSIQDGARVEQKPLVITNFEARITAQEYLDDGTGVTDRVVRVEGKLSSGRKLPVAQVPSADWTDTEKWIAKYWGTDPLIWVDAGKNRAARVKEAVALTGHAAPSRRVITHSGWVQHEGKLAFLTNGRVSGCAPEVAEAIRRDADIRLAGELERYEVPEQTTSEHALCAYRWVERFARCAEYETTAPLIAAMFLAPLKHFLPIDLAIALVGKTGTRKSSIVGAILSLFAVRGFDRKSLPVSFRSTANMIERVAFYAKDIPLVVDNYVPDRKGLEQEKLERIAHTVGDGTARGRMKRDETISAGKPARGVLLVTGEDMPQGNSSVARFYTITRGGSETLHLTELGDVQDAAARGELAPAMTHYLGWISQQLENKSFIPRLNNLYQDMCRSAASERDHGRLAEQSSWIRLGLALATESHPDGQWKHPELHEMMNRSLDRQCKVRGSITRETSISHRFLSSLQSAVDMGILCGVNPVTGHRPTARATEWGWHENVIDENSEHGSKLYPLSHPGVYITREVDDAKHWYICARPQHIIMFLREKLSASLGFADSHVAVGNALAADGLLHDQGEAHRGPKLWLWTKAQHWVWKIDGPKAMRLLGQEED